MQLANKAFMHRIMPQIPEFDDVRRTRAQRFVLERYSRAAFQGILPDTGAAKKSTGGHEQFLALQHENPPFKLDTAWAGDATIRFGDGEPIDSIGAVKLDTPIGRVRFHIMPTPTPFLLCLQDMDDLGVHCDNILNAVITTDSKHITVTREWGRPWFFLREQEAQGAFLTQRAG
jgi:hypothetical protein